MTRKTRILIEGLDRTGKSTVAELLSKDLGIPIIHFDPPPSREKKKTDDFYLGELEKFEISSPRGYIIDRLHWSNRVYNGCFGGGVLTDSEYMKLEDHLEGKAAVPILMLDEPSFIKRRIDIEIDEYQAKNPDAAVSRILTINKIEEMQRHFFTLQWMSRLAKFSLNLAMIHSEKAKAQDYRTPEYVIFLTAFRDYCHAASVAQERKSEIARKIQ